MIPLILRLRKEIHKKIAEAQDLIVQEMLNSFNSVVLHGGTAIWRCYKGNRFSEDIDVYIQKDINKINLFFKNLEKKGFIVKKKRIKENSLFSDLQFNRVSVKFEALFKNVKGVLKDYETIEGNYIVLYSLTPEELIAEKVNAYIKRLKIRDIYDIFFLLKYVDDKNKIKMQIQKLFKEFKSPVDEKELRILVLEGIAPNYKEILDYLKRWEK